MSRLNVPFVLLASCLSLACTVGDGGGGSFGDGASDGTSADTGGSGGSGSGESGDQVDGDSGGGDTGGGDDFVDEARKEFPTYLDLHEKVITRTCTPFENVCHNNKEYPDLRTPQSMLGLLGAPCNLDVETPLDMFNGCEPVADVVRFTSGGNIGYEVEVAYVNFTTDPMGAVTAAVIYLAQPMPMGMLDPMTAESIEVVRTTNSGMLTVGEVNDAITYAVGIDAIQVTGYDMLGDSVHTLLEDDLRGGDPNRDGVFGAEGEHLFEIAPGDPWSSYMLQRVQGNVPGSPMPLANQPLSAAEIVAIACWIEGTADPGGDSPYAEINYDTCDYAAQFGEPDPDSGATFTNHVAPILETRCATPGCHSSNQPAAELDLTPEVARDNLFGISTQDPSLPFVEPGVPTPASSYLMTKLTSNGQSGVQMPPGSPLTEDEINTIRDWIYYGAPND